MVTPPALLCSISPDSCPLLCRPQRCKPNDAGPGRSVSRSRAGRDAVSASTNRLSSLADRLVPHGEGHTPVVLGHPGDEPLLGVVTLEELGLVLNPFNRRLQPMRLML
jgi:hypothetical protein